MSMSDPELDDIEQYRSTASKAEAKFADLTKEHDLKKAFGDSEQARRIEIEPEIIAERIAQWYDDPAAAIREFFSNAETANVRRSGKELERAGIDRPNTVEETIALAREKTGYDPVIEVTYNRDPNETRLIIEDNGIGISSQEYTVLRKIGYSMSHMDGDRLGEFGMGYMSGFQLTGTDGFFRMYTNSFITDENYSTTNYIVNFEWLDGLKDGYGTRFEFPNFCHKAERIDVREKVAHFSQGLRVPLIYREMDEDGKEVYNEDYLPHSLADDYDDDDLIVTVDNEFFEAVMSPNSPDNRSYVTYNISMPIRRNLDRSHGSLNAIWRWDFRGKKENGPIVRCESDPSVVGKAPVSDNKFEDLSDERKPSFIRRSDVPDDALVMPVPASSRDSYEGGHDEFWYYVSDCLMEAYRDVVAELIGKLTSFDDFQNLSSREKQQVIRGYNSYGPGYGRNSVDRVKQAVKENLGVDLPDDVANKIDYLDDSVMYVPRRTRPNRISYKTSCSYMRMWKLVHRLGGGEVYMGKAINARKAKLVWALNDENIIVRVENVKRESSEETYERLEEMWGWKLLRDVPLRGLKEKYPNLDDDLIEEIETARQTSSSSTRRGNVRTSRDPRTKEVRVYSGRDSSPLSSKNHRAETLYEAMDGGDTFHAGRFRAQFLVVFDQTEVDRISEVKKHTYKSGRVAAAAVPKYVYNYLIQAKNVFNSLDEVEAHVRKNTTIDLSDGRTVDVTDLPDDTMFIVDSHGLDRYVDDQKPLLNWFEENMDLPYDHVEFVNGSAFDKFWAIDIDDEHMYRFSYGSPGVRVERPSGRGYMSLDEIVYEIEVPDIDWDHEFMNAVNQRGRMKGDFERTMVLVDYLKQFDALPTN